MKVARQPSAGASASAARTASSPPTAYSEKITPPAPVARDRFGHTSVV